MAPPINTDGRKPPALGLMCRRLAELVDIPPRVSPSEWAATSFRVPDGPFAGQLWNPELTPWWIEPLDAMGPDSPHNKGVVRKGAQSGATVFGLAFLAHSIVFDPCRMMVVQPTDTALTKFSRGKLQPVIEKCDALRKLVRSQTSRSAAGSTTYIKAFPGGELNLALASSASDLSGDTVKKILKDEVDRYPEDVGGEGPPSKLIESRRKTFSVTGDWKELAISTPTIKGASEIDEEFEAGDQRWWHVVCPQCTAKVRLLRSNFLFDRAPPYQPRYAMQCCGLPVQERQMRRLLQRAQRDGGGWIPLNPGAPHLSWHFDDLTSPFETWENNLGLNPRNREDNDALLYINSMTTTVEIDSAGRVALGKIDETARGHRERLGLDGDLMVVGAGDHFEIWNAERWNAKFKPEDAAEKFESLFFVD